MSEKCNGGYARAAALSPERRSEIARKAAQARWSSTVTAKEKIADNCNLAEATRLLQNELRSSFARFAKRTQEYREEHGMEIDCFVFQSYDLAEDEFCNGKMFTLPDGTPNPLRVEPVFRRRGSKT